MVPEIGGPFSKVEFEKTNLNSPVQLKDFLLSQGWKPTSFTENGSPQLTEDSYESIQGDIGKLIAERAVLKHRLGMLFTITKDMKFNGWLNKVRSDGRLEAGGIPQGTPTGRYRHIGIVNVPKADPTVLYGEEFRSLFIPKSGYKFMGVDANSLEAGMEAHYCYPFKGGKEYANILLFGTKEEGTDVHTRNSKIWNVSRNIAKNGKYCLSYGGQAPKLAETLGVPEEDAKKYFDMFWDGNIALKSLKKTVDSAFKSRGYLIGLDGRKLHSRSTHSLLNLLFQSAGSIVVKTATCFMANWVRDRELDAKQVMHFHDEFTYEFHPKHEEEICELAAKAFKKAGEYWKLNVEMGGDPKVGMNWKEIH